MAEENTPASSYSTDCDDKQTFFEYMERFNSTLLGNSDASDTETLLGDILNSGETPSNSDEYISDFDTILLGDHLAVENTCGLVDGILATIDEETSFSSGEYILRLLTQHSLKILQLMTTLPYPIKEYSQVLVKIHRQKLMMSTSAILT